jgi:hypothetical protein
VVLLDAGRGPPASFSCRALKWAVGRTPSPPTAATAISSAGQEDTKPEAADQELRHSQAKWPSSALPTRGGLRRSPPWPVPKPGASPTEGSGDQARLGCWRATRRLSASSSPTPYRHTADARMRMLHPAHHSPATSPEMRDLRTAKCLTDAAADRSESICLRTRGPIARDEFAGWLDGAGHRLVWHLPAAMMAGRSPVWPGGGGRWLLVWLFGPRHLNLAAGPSPVLLCRSPLTTTLRVAAAHQTRRATAGRGRTTVLSSPTRYLTDDGTDDVL